MTAAKDRVGAGQMLLVGTCLLVLSFAYPQTNTSKVQVSEKAYHNKREGRPRAVAEYLFENATEPGLDSSGRGNGLDVVGTARTHFDPIRGNVLFCDNVGEHVDPGSVSYLSFIPDKDRRSSEQLSDSIPTGNSPYTLAAWILPRSERENGILGWGHYGSKDQSTSMQTQGYTKLMNVWWSKDLTIQVGKYEEKWSHVACTFNGTSRACFWNGEEKGRDFPEPHHSQSEFFHVGHTHHGAYFDGFLDDVRVFDVAITNEHIAFLAERPFAAPVPVEKKESSVSLHDVIATAAGVLLVLLGLNTLKLAARAHAKVGGGIGGGEYEGLLGEGLLGEVMERTPMERVWRQCLGYARAGLGVVRAGEARALVGWRCFCCVCFWRGVGGDGGVGVEGGLEGGLEAGAPILGPMLGRSALLA
jgi:hypothetical protein